MTYSAEISDISFQDSPYLSNCVPNFGHLFTIVDVEKAILRRKGDIVKHKIWHRIFPKGKLPVYLFNHSFKISHKGINIKVCLILRLGSKVLNGDGLRECNAYVIKLMAHDFCPECADKCPPAVCPP